MIVLLLLFAPHLACSFHPCNPGQQHHLRNLRNPSAASSCEVVSGTIRCLDGHALVMRILNPIHDELMLLEQAPYRFSLQGLQYLGKAMHGRVKFKEKEYFQQEVLQALSDCFGDKHPDTLLSRSNLAGTKFYNGDLHGAEQLQQEVSDASICAFGHDHQRTLTSMSNLAIMLQSNGDLQLAEQLQRDVLQSRIHTLGSQHENTLCSKSSLASIMQSQGDLESAQELYWQALEARTLKLGPEHLDTLRSKSHFASILQSCGDLKAAEELQQEVFEVKNRTLGSHHPTTVSAATAYHGQWLAGEVDAREVHLLHSMAPKWPKILEYAILREKQFVEGCVRMPPPVQISMRPANRKWWANDGAHRLYAAMLSGLPVRCKWKKRQRTWDDMSDQERLKWFSVDKIRRGQNIFQHMTQEEKARWIQVQHQWEVTKR